jgi:heme/copper-type cytochrome/quinol oxidase subunit 2
MKYRWREGEPDPEQVAGNRTVEIVWTVIPLSS